MPPSSSLSLALFSSLRARSKKAMVLHLELAFFAILASLVFLCIVVATLRDMAESQLAGRVSTPQDSPEETAAPAVQGLSSQRKAAELEGNRARSDSNGSVGWKLASDDRTARGVEITGSGGIGRESLKEEFDGIERELAGADDDWEGIEKSESARLFGRAIQFACAARNFGLISEIHGEPTMRLYALHKAALEGPCREPRPTAFRVSARAKWNAWQRLGNISPEVAMEEYIHLLSEKFPNWMQQNDTVEGVDCTDAETFWKLICNLRTAIEQQTRSDRNRLQELNPATMILTSLGP